MKIFLWLLLVYSLLAMVGMSWHLLLADVNQLYYHRFVDTAITNFYVTHIPLLVVSCICLVATSGGGKK